MIDIIIADAHAELNRELGITYTDADLTNYWADGLSDEEREEFGTMDEFITAMWNASSF